MLSRPICWFLLIFSMISVRKNWVFKYYSHRSNVADSKSYNIKILEDFEKQSQRKNEEGKRSIEKEN